MSTIREYININTDLTQVVGDKNYEFTNLPTTFGVGNVLQVVTDRKLAQDNGIYDPITGLYSSATEDGIIDYFTADVVSQSDYYPFGMILPGRNESGDYRYGFQNQETDDEVSGEGNSYDFGARMYNPRVGRFLSIDPKVYNFSGQSPYIITSNSPIQAIQGASAHHGKRWVDKEQKKKQKINMVIKTSILMEDVLVG